MKTVLITGATGVIGRAVVEQLTKTSDYAIVAIVRDSRKGELFVRSIFSANNFYNLKTWSMDLGDKYQMQQFSRNWRFDVDILINCAAVAPRVRTETTDGVEMQWAVNVLSYYRLCNYLFPFMNRGGRMINVSSQYAGDLDLSDPEFKQRQYDNKIAYRQSKLCIRLMTAGFAEMLIGDVTVNCVHPGGVQSNLTRDLIIGADDTPETAAESIIHLATAAELEGVTGKYFEYKEQVECPYVQEKEQVEKLMQLLKTY